MGEVASKHSPQKLGVVSQDGVPKKGGFEIAGRERRAPSGPEPRRHAVRGRAKELSLPALPSLAVVQSWFPPLCCRGAIGCCDGCDCGTAMLCSCPARHMCNDHHPDLLFLCTGQGPKIAASAVNTGAA